MPNQSQGAAGSAEKSYFRIGEVGRLTATKTFVLRYWETEFPTLQPLKSPKGHRLYRRQDIETVFEIKRLLYEEGFTIAGARRHLSEQNGSGNGGGATRDRAAALRPTAETLPRAQRKLLLDLREALQAVLTLLERR